VIPELIFIILTLYVFIVEFKFCVVYIAATALHIGLTLVTNNSKDFKNIDGLEVMNPYD
jgi:hypothetical protein